MELRISSSRTGINTNRKLEKIYGLLNQEKIPTEVWIYQWKLVKTEYGRLSRKISNTVMDLEKEAILYRNTLQTLCSSTSVSLIYEYLRL